MTRTYDRTAARRSQGTTDCQRDLVDEIRLARLDHPTYGPSVRELAVRLGVCPSDVYQKLNRLRRDGVVAWTDGVTRSIYVVGE